MTIYFKIYVEMRKEVGLMPDKLKIYIFLKGNQIACSEGISFHYNLPCYVLMWRKFRRLFQCFASTRGLMKTFNFLQRFHITQDDN